VRTLKARGVRSFAFIAPPSIPAEEAVKSHRRRRAGGVTSIPIITASDRKDQKIEELTIVVSGNADDTRARKGRARSADHRRIAELHARSSERAFQS